MKKHILFVFISAILIGLVACDEEEVNPLCGYWYVDPDDSHNSDYYHFIDYGYSNRGGGEFYDKNYYNGGSLSCDFSWEVDDEYLFLHYKYYNSYTKKDVEKRVLYYYDISGKHLILRDPNNNYVGTYTKR